MTNEVLEDVASTETTESPLGGWFVLAARIEALTWLGLLVAMAFKYVITHDPIGVKIMGPIHGCAFLAYVGLTLASARTFGWSVRLTAVALLASIPPLATWPFERYAVARGRLR